jgi:lactoylglutathione lyase
MSGPTVPRWTHIALPAGDLDASILWYTEFTPLVLLDRREDPDGQSAWLCHERQIDNPFILVLVMFWRDKGRPSPIMTPFAHLGIEVPARSDVDSVADRARTAGCLVWEPADLPDPIGYVCAIADPDGNVIEISHNQGVYAKVQEVWGRSDPS